MSGNFGNTSIDTKRNVGNFDLLVANRVVANKIEANSLGLETETQISVPLTITGLSFTGNAGITIKLEKLSPTIAVLTLPNLEVTGINNGGLGTPIDFESVESLPEEFIPSITSSQFSPVFEIFPPSTTQLNAARLYVNPLDGRLFIQSPFGLFSGNGNQIGFLSATYVYSL